MNPAKVAPIHPNIIDVIRMYRDVRGISFEEARTQAIKSFKKHGWPVPESIQRLEDRYGK